MALKRGRTQAERTAASDSAMFRASIKLIAQQGPQAMTLASVGKEAGFTGGLVTYRFGSKAGLLQAVCDRVFELWRKNVVNVAGVEQITGLKSINKLTELYFHALRDRSDLLLALFRLMNESHTAFPELIPFFREFDGRIREHIGGIVDRGKKANVFSKSIDTESFSIVYLGMLRGTAMQYMIEGETMDLDKAEAMVSKVCQRSLAIQRKTKSK